MKASVSPRVSRSQNGARAKAGAAGWRALLELPTALAFVEEGRLTVKNASFEELEQKSSGAAWERVDPDAKEPPKAYRSMARLLIAEASMTGASSPVTRLYRQSGQNRYIEASYWHARGKSKSNQVVVLIQEATARVQSEHENARIRDALVQHERMRAIGELASGVAHDLNNTLHAMNLRLSLVEQNDACRSAQGTNIAALSRAISDAALVVGRLQDFARQKSDRSLDSIDVSAVVAEAIEMVRTTVEGESSLDGAPVRIRTDLPPLPTITALASEIRHVVVNLLLNARDALPRGGIIEVIARQSDDRVILEVKDDGSGIPEKDLENIFCPFFTTKGTRGTGLGLSNARSVLGRQGGEISAKNRPEGGACFSLSFPIASSQDAAPPPRFVSDVPLGHRVLVVDDDLDNLQATRMVLELHGQSVDIALTSADAMTRLVAGARYDLILCDLGMRDMNGWRLAREIQKVAPGTSVYILTGWAQDVKADDQRRRWVKGVLQKPMEAEMLRELLADNARDSTPPSPVSGSGSEPASSDLG
ncbi:MAG: ATP-binding protein [Polyangiaceae bacterium]